MKKLLLITIVSISFLSCKKSTNSLSVSSTYLPGTWNRVALTDTIYSAGKYYGSNIFNISINQATMQFRSDGTGTNSSRGEFTYTGSTNSVVFKSTPTVIWRIINITNSGFELYILASDHSESWGDYYTK